jgi:DNA repair photolyase
LLHNLQREAAKLKGETVSIANSSDPYPRIEAETGLTRMCLAILAQHDCRVQIITKSALVSRDTDFLSKILCTVALTITTDDGNTAKLIEPHAPSPTERLKTVEALTSKGIPVSVRIDPVIPFLNDNPQCLIADLASIGVKHLTSSTYKIKPDNWQKLATAMPELAEKLKPLYFQQGEKMGGCTLLPKELRLKLMKKVRSLAIENGMKFGVCRENLSQLNTATCDGSWQLPKSTR